MTHEFPSFRMPGSPLWRHAAGTSMVDTSGRSICDMAMGFGAYLHGHDAPRGILQEYLAGPHGPAPGLGDLHAHELRDAACARLCRWAAPHWGAGGCDPAELRALVQLSGSEAVETALKTALLATGRTDVVAFEGGYHGTFGLPLAVTSTAAFREPFAHQYGSTVSFRPWGVVPQIDERVACVVVEPIQGRAGVVVPPPGFLSQLRQACDAAGALLVVDSVLVGAGRTGVALEGADADPDIICVGKSLGAGIPASATIGRRDIAERAWGAIAGEAIHTATFVGHPLACRAILHVLERLLPSADLDQHAAWRDAIEPAAERLAWQVRGKGLLWAIDTGVEGGGVALAAQLLRRGLLAAPSGADGRCVTLTPAWLDGSAQRQRLSKALDTLG